MEVLIVEESLQNFSHKKFYSFLLDCPFSGRVTVKVRSQVLHPRDSPLHVRDKPHQRGLRLTLFTNSRVGSFYLPFELSGKSE